MNRLKSAAVKLDTRPECAVLLLALLVNLIVESFARRSFIDAIVFLFTKPLFFFLGFLIVAATMSLSLLFRKRYFWMMLFAVIWIALGITDCVLMIVRLSPLEGVDFAILRTGLGIIGMYLKLWQFILIVAALLLVIAAMIVFLIRSKRRRVFWRRALILLVAIALLLTGMVLLVQLTDLTPDTFYNLALSYERYGFAYCFSCSLFDRGVDRPDGYSKGTIENLQSEIEQALPQTEEEHPNIIVLQLESFIDPTRIEGMSFSENPLPFFTALKEQYTSGYLTVPTIGAGTANTEFEVITGMSHHHFGTGEYPYKTFLKEQPCESYAYVLKNLGYQAHAIHDYTATFYDRNIAYSYLGFDTFTSMEYMENLTYNQLGWAEDRVLTQSILDCLNSTSGPDYVMTVSVQGHGKYPDDFEDPGPITVTMPGLDESDLARYRYYVNQIHQMDLFLSELIEALSALDEEVVLVVYGDHLPSVGDISQVFSEEDLYRTEYVIWSNRDTAPQPDRDLAAYQVVSYALEGVGIQDGTMNAIHQTMSEEEDYDYLMRLLEYDLLYGGCYVYQGANPYRRTELQFGVNEICVTGVSTLNGTTTVRGEHFTPWSVVYVNGKKQDTVFLSSGQLSLRGVTLSSSDQVTVTQITNEKYKLSTTQPYSVP